MGSEVSPVEIYILQVAHRATSEVVVSIVVSLGLVEVDKWIGQVDDRHEVVPGLSGAIGGGYVSDSLYHGNIFGGDDDELVWSDGLSE